MKKEAICLFRKPDVTVTVKKEFGVPCKVTGKQPRCTTCSIKEGTAGGGASSDSKFRF